VRPLADQEGGHRGAGQEARALRRARRFRVAEDVDAVARDLGEGRQGRVERLGQRDPGFADRLHEGEVVAALGVEQAPP
jgi:hypothetical protein